ncbi:MAG: 6-bladed beta-propeller [Bacteroidales bacterium]|nr:6-bladed beta-propeller [Bacteroidales bacterium]
MKRLFVYLLLSGVFSACGSNATYVDDSIVAEKCNIDRVLDNDDFDITDLIDSVRIIRLETTDGSVLSTFRKCVVSDDFIYILDNYKGGGVAVFDVSGKFVRRIPTGNGPGELAGPNNIAFDSSKNELLVCQNVIVNKYTPDGIYISSHKASQPLSQLVPYKNGYLAVQNEYCNSENRFAFLVLDSVFNDVDTYYFNEQICDIFSEYISESSEGEIKISRPLVDKIYKYTDGKVVVDKTLEYPDNKLDLSDMDWQNVSRYINKIRESKNKFCLMSYCATDNYEYYKFYRGHMNANVFYNKTTKKYRSGYYIDNFESINNVGDLLGTTYNEFFISTINPGANDYYFNNREKIIEYNQHLLNDDEIAMLRELKEDHNPLLVLYSLKDIADE